MLCVIILWENGGQAIHIAQCVCYLSALQLPRLQQTLHQIVQLFDIISCVHVNFQQAIGPQGLSFAGTGMYWGLAATACMDSEGKKIASPRSGSYLPESDKDYKDY